jgi:hypothetical protein
MHTRATFLEAFPIFTEVDEATLDAALAEAELSIDVTVWGKWENAGHGQLTAHLLTNSPTGQAAKYVPPKDPLQPKTTYEAEFKRLQRIVTAGMRSI